MCIAATVQTDKEYDTNILRPMSVHLITFTNFFSLTSQNMEKSIFSPESLRREKGREDNTADAMDIFIVLKLF